MHESILNEVFRTLPGAGLYKEDKDHDKDKGEEEPHQVDVRYGDQELECDHCSYQVAHEEEGQTPISQDPSEPICK